MLENPKSKDAFELVQAIDAAIKNKNWDHAQDVWDYIKGSRLQIGKDLTAAERASLNKFVEDKRLEGTYLLKRGSLEDYLPDGFKGKDIEKLISFLRQGDFWLALDSECRSEIEVIIRSVLQS